jgi:hypothetical protein
MTLAGVSFGSNVTAVALGSGQPFVLIAKYGQGRAVQWTSTDWMAVAVKGPMAGLDDLVWRGLAWSARKPFVVRGMPHFLTLRVDDSEGPFWWLQIANNLGFKPWTGPFIASAQLVTNISELRNLATNGNATVSPHAFDNSNLVYWGYDAPVSDYQTSNSIYAATQWHQTNGIPIAKVIVPHVSDIGSNAFPFLKSWGAPYVTIKQDPSTPRSAPWLVNGPFRLYEPRLAGSSLLPLFYADFLNIPNHPELAGQFFDCVTEIRDESDGNNLGEWAAYAGDLPGTISRGTRQVKRAFDSMALGTLYTHEWRIHQNIAVPPGVSGVSTFFTSNTWSSVLQSITNNLAAYQPVFVTLDYGCQYVRATRTAILTSATYDTLSGRVSATFTGKSDVDISAQVYVGQDNSISQISGTVPAFTNAETVTLAALGPVLSSAAMSPDHSVRFSVNAVSNVPWRLDVSTDLVAWTALSNFSNAGGSFPFVDWAATNSPRRFYRAVPSP